MRCVPHRTSLTSASSSPVPDIGYPALQPLASGHTAVHSRRLASLRAARHLPVAAYRCQSGGGRLGPELSGRPGTFSQALMPPRSSDTTLGGEPRAMECGVTCDTQLLYASTNKGANRKVVQGGERASLTSDCIRFEIVPSRPPPSMGITTFCGKLRDINVGYGHRAEAFSRAWSGVVKRCR